MLCQLSPKFCNCMSDQHTLPLHWSSSLLFLYSGVTTNRDPSFPSTTYHVSFLCNRWIRFVQVAALFSLMHESRSLSERDKLNENFGRFGGRKTSRVNTTLYRRRSQIAFSYRDEFSHLKSFVNCECEKKDSKNDSTVKIRNFVIKYWVIKNGSAVILQWVCCSSCHWAWYRSMASSSHTSHSTTMRKECALSMEGFTMALIAGVTVVMLEPQQSQ